MSLFARIINFYRDPEYFPEVRRIAVPIIFQQAVFSGLNMLAVVFVGQKGDAAVAAVGLAGQIAFLLNLVHFGIISGAAMFTAQFWGRGDVANLRRVLGLCLTWHPQPARDVGITLLFDPKDQDYPFKGKGQAGYGYKLKAN